MPRGQRPPQQTGTGLPDGTRKMGPMTPVVGVPLLTPATSPWGKRVRSDRAGRWAGWGAHVPCSFCLYPYTLHTHARM